MTTDELLKILENRSLKVALCEDGRLILQGNRARTTPTLLRVLKLPTHREELLRRLAGQPTVKTVDVVETPVEPPKKEQLPAPSESAPPCEVLTTAEMDQLDPWHPAFTGRCWSAAEWEEFKQMRFQ